MKSKNLFDAFDGIDASMILEAEPVKKEVVAMTSRRRIRKPLIFVAAMILCVATLSIGAFAGRRKGEMEPYWNQVFLPRENTETNLLDSIISKESSSESFDNEIIDRLDDISSVPETVSFVGDNDDVMFNVIGMTGAGNAAYVWLEMTVSDELMEKYGDQIETFMPGRTDREVIDFKSGKISGSGGSMTVPLGSKASLLGTDRINRAKQYATEFTSSAGENGEAQVRLTARPDNTLCFAYQFQLNNTTYLTGRQLTLIFYDVQGKPSAEAEKSVTVAEGTWKLTMEMNFTESALTFRPNVTGAQFVCDMSDPSRVRRVAPNKTYVTEAELVGATVQISPIYMQIEMRCRLAYGIGLRTPNYAIVVMADGSQMEVRSSGGGGSSSSNSDIAAVQIDFFFDEPIDHKQVVAVIYGGLTFPLTGETLAE